MNRIKRILFTALLAAGIVTLIPMAVMAQGDEVAMSEDFLFKTVLVFIGIIIIVLIVVIFSLQSTRNSLMEEEARRGKEQGVPVREESKWWSGLMARLTRTVPIEKEQDILLDHNYDGIRELDNHLPPWWTWLFNITIVFGVVYLLIYHVFQVAPLQTEEYDTEISEANEAAQARQAALVASGDAFDESTIEFTDDPDILARGETIFVRQCAACHMDDGRGGIGPNLTDQYWLHGGSMANIYTIIKVGVPDKGMISWEAVLSPEQMRDVGSYILMLQNTNPENAKEPQGELYEGTQ